MRPKPGCNLRGHIQPLPSRIEVKPPGQSFLIRVGGLLKDQSDTAPMIRTGTAQAPRAQTESSTLSPG